MPSARSPLALLALALLVLGAASCSSHRPTDGAGGSAPAPGGAQPPPPAAAPPGPRPAEGPGAAAGADVAALSPAAQRELAAVMSDEFCYCGCPHTLEQCVKGHECRHGKRMQRLAAMLVRGGAPATEVIVELGRYYGSFREPRAQLPVDERMCLGDAKAPVTVLEFSDFECPYCAQARPLLESFARKNSRLVRLCYAPYPLPTHPNAREAAAAALWARDQGKFWPMHDALFEHQEEGLAAPTLVKVANKLGLKGAELARVLEQGTYREEVRRFSAAGKQAGVSGTPALFFNGRPYGLSPLTEEALLHAAEDEAEWAAHKGAWAAD